MWPRSNKFGLSSTKVGRVRPTSGGDFDHRLAMPAASLAVFNQNLARFAQLRRGRCIVVHRFLGCPPAALGGSFGNESAAATPHTRQKTPWRGLGRRLRASVRARHGGRMMGPNEAGFCTTKARMRVHSPRRREKDKGKGFFAAPK